MYLKWEHQIYKEDFASKQIYLEELDNIIDAMEKDLTSIERVLNNSNIYNMNSMICKRIIEHTEEIQDEYKSIIKQLERYKLELR